MHRFLFIFLYIFLFQNAYAQKPRARELGISIGVLPTGTLNAITDVAGVKLGHITIIKGDSVRTGVTAIFHMMVIYFSKKFLLLFIQVMVLENWQALHRCRN